MAFALSTAHQIGLALTGALFIAFALVSSFVFAGRNPEFPGRHRNLYLVVCVAFFLAMMAAVLVFGREEPESEAATGTTTTSTTTAPKVQAGDPAAGKTQFTASGCSACHTFQPAGANGKVGPDLDNLKESAQKAGQELDAFIATSITDPNAYIAPGFKPGVMPKLPLDQKQVADLVAFLSSGQ
jgi:mono/diheme cytochrome c family protein